MSNQFRKKPVVIEAFQMTEARRMDNAEWPEWLNMAWNGERDQAGTLQRVSMEAVLPDSLEIVTLEGNHLVTWGDWIIQGVKGELYPCKPDIFAATYEAESAAQSSTTGEPTWKSKAITLSAIQLAEALEFAAPDFDNDEDQRETEVCVAWAPENTVSNDEGGFEAPGYVVWLEEYPEEGCMPLDGGNPRPLVSIENERRRKAAAESQP